MANFVLSYDLNGPHPTHAEMDRHLERLGCSRARILETVWWVDYAGTALDLCDAVKTILRPEDMLLVVEAANMAWTSLLINDKALQNAWHEAA